MSFVLLDEKLSALSERLTGSPHVASIEIFCTDKKIANILSGP